MDKKKPSWNYLKGPAFEKCAFDWLKKTVRENYPNNYKEIQFHRLKKLTGKSGSTYTFDIVMESQGIFARDDGQPDLRWFVECKCKNYIDTQDVIAFIKEAEDVGGGNMMFLYHGHLNKTPRELIKYYNVTACDLSKEFYKSKYYKEIFNLIRK